MDQGGQDRAAGVGQGSYCRNNSRTKRVDLSGRRRTRHEDEPRLESLAGQSAEDPVQSGTLFQLAQILRLQFRHHRQSAAAPFHSADAGDGRSGISAPRRCTGTRKVSTDREITDTTHLLAEFPERPDAAAMAGSTVNEQGLPDMIRGRKATLYFASSQNKAELQAGAALHEEMEAENFSDPQPTESMPRLEKNFFDCIRTGKTPFANIELAIRGPHRAVPGGNVRAHGSDAALRREDARTIKTRRRQGDSADELRHRSAAAARGVRWR